MSQTTSIEWTDVTWNPVRGCSRVSEGCRHCYAETMAARFSGPGLWGHGYAERSENGPRWTGKVDLVPEKLAEPLSWRSPRRCFVNSTSDLFHESLPFEHIAAVFGVMAACPHITFQILTKRPERASEFFRWLEEMAERLASWKRAHLLSAAVIRQGIPGEKRLHASTLESRGWPLPNVWLGTSVEDQTTADRRIPYLLSCSAAVHFVSYEPALRPVDLRAVVMPDGDSLGLGLFSHGEGEGVDWIICGGESGLGARPMHPDWARSARDQCTAAGVPFFFKQWGEYGSRSVTLTGEPVMPRMFPDYLTWSHKGDTWINGGVCVDTKGRVLKIGRDMMLARDEGTFPVAVMHRMGKAAAGRLLDGRTHDEFPEVGRG